MKKLALIALLGISGLANAAYMASVTDSGPVRRDIISQDPVGTPVYNAQPIVTDAVVVEGPVVTPADGRYYYTPYGQRPVANTVQGATNVASDAVESVGSAAASVIPF